MPMFIALLIVGGIVALTAGLRNSGLPGNSTGDEKIAFSTVAVGCLAIAFAGHIMFAGAS